MAKLVDVSTYQDVTGSGDVVQKVVLSQVVTIMVYPTSSPTGYSISIGLTNTQAVTKNFGTLQEAEAELAMWEQLLNNA